MFPTIGDYNQTIQIKGANAFTTLRTLNFVAAKTFPIKVYLFGSGSYAVVFKANDQGRYFAIRCFITAENETIKRYKEICDYLNTIKVSWKADSQFLENEINVNGNLFPVLKMEWIEGVLINQFVTSNLNNNNILSLIQNKLVIVCESLEQNKIGHGDLQCGNILVQGTVDNFSIKLIDYDGMFVPSLSSKMCIEKGRSEFQHPNRNSSHFSYDIDRFSIWVMVTAIEALKFDKSLWKEVMQGGFNTLDNFLFTTNDFRNPNQSRLFNRLQQIHSPSLDFYTEKLKWFCNHDASLIEKPSLYDVVKKGVNVPQELPKNYDVSDITKQQNDSNFDKITIISNKVGSIVLTSSFKKLGTTPLQIDRNNFIGKTLLISYASETKKIDISDSDNIIKVWFSESESRSKEQPKNIKTDFNETDELPAKNDIDLKTDKTKITNQNSFHQNDEQNRQHNPSVKRNKNKASNNGETFALVFLILLCAVIILIITYSRYTSTSENIINNQIDVTSNKSTKLITDTTKYIVLIEEKPEPFNLFMEFNLNGNKVEIFKLNKNDTSSISSIHDYILFSNSSSQYDSIDFSSSISLVDSTWLHASSELTDQGTVVHDMNINGLPDLMISTFSFGAHCCFRYLVFEFKENGGGYSIIFDSGETDAGDLLSNEDLDKDGRKEIIYYDDLFAYWHTSYASSPMPKLIFEYIDEEYKLSTRLMMKQIVNIDSLNNLALGIQQSSSWPNYQFQSYKEFLEFDSESKGISFLSPLWEHMLNLTYSGNLTLAHSFLYKSWPESNSYGPYFWHDFISQLKKGRYWSTIKEMNDPTLTQ